MTSRPPENSEFWGEYESLVTAAGDQAHLIAMMVLQDEDSAIDPGIRLDYASLLQRLVKLLADYQYAEDSHTFAHTLSNGPVAVERSPEGGFRVFRFDRVELSPEDVSENDMESIYEAYSRLISQ